jgi:cell division protein FtsW
MAVVRPLLMLGGVALLLLLEPDFGTAVVLLGTALGMIFLAGVNIWRFLGLQGVILVLMTGLLYSSEYRRARLVSFLDPWADPFNSGFQLTQSLIAIGRGELLGVGLGASVQKLFYLPEAHTDFLFAILAEELGLIGVLLVIALYAIIVVRAFAIAARAEWLEARFAAYLAYGIGLWFGIQALFNMGVTLGVLPTKGLTLPLLSNGGSSVVIMCIALAILLRIDGEMRRADPRLRRQSAHSSTSEEAAKPVKKGVFVQRRHLESEKP